MPDLEATVALGNRFSGSPNLSQAQVKSSQRLIAYDRFARRNFCITHWQEHRSPRVNTIGNL